MLVLSSSNYNISLVFDNEKEFHLVLSAKQSFNLNVNAVYNKGELYLLPV